MAGLAIPQWNFFNVARYHRTVSGCNHNQIQTFYSQNIFQFVLHRVSGYQQRPVSTLFGFLNQSFRDFSLFQTQCCVFGKIGFSHACLSLCPLREHPRREHSRKKSTLTLTPHDDGTKLFHILHRQSVTCAVTIIIKAENQAFADQLNKSGNGKTIITI